MKEFDLEKALAGEPVALRNGDKGFVLKQLEKPLSAGTVLIGYVSGEDNWEYQCAWSKTGRAYSSFEENQFDIVGMWEDPPEKIKIGNFEFPKPESEPLTEGDLYYCVAPHKAKMVEPEEWYGDGFDMRWLKRGIVHKTREAAEQHAKVLIAISQGETSLDD